MPDPQSVTGWQGVRRIRDLLSQTGDARGERFQQVGRLSAIHVACVGVLTAVLTRVPLTALLKATTIGNRVEWRKGWDSNLR